MPLDRLRQEVRIDIGTTPSAKRNIAQTTGEVRTLEASAKRARAALAGVRSGRIATGGGSVGAASTGGNAVLTGEGIKLFGLAKFSSTGLTLEGGELISRVGGKLLVAAALGRAVEGVTTLGVNFRDRINAGLDIGTAAAQGGIDGATRISRGLLTAFGVEGVAKNLYSLFTGASQEEASAKAEAFWDFFTLDETKRVQRKAEAEAFRKEAREQTDAQIETLKQADIAQSNDFLDTWGIPLSQRSQFRSKAEAFRQNAIEQERQHRYRLIDEHARNEFVTS